MLNLFDKECRVVNIRQETCDVYIGRGSKWGNHYVIGKEGDRDEVCDKYEKGFFTQPQLIADLPELVGKTIGCYCKPKRCHGDFLVEQVRKLLEANSV